MLLIFQISSPNECDGSEVDKKDTTLARVVVEKRHMGFLACDAWLITNLTRSFGREEEDETCKGTLKIRN